MLDQNMLERVLSLSKGERLDYDRSLTWVDLFRKEAALHPDKEAVIAENGSLSYGELDRLSDALACSLRTDGAFKPDEYIAVRMGRVKEFPLAVLAIHKAGAAYLPIDLDYPVGRISYMMEDSGARLTLTEQSVKKMLKKALEQASDVASGAADSYSSSLLCKMDSSSFLSLCAPDRPAYMIYTSGSTGKPKGVVIPQRALTNFVHFIVHRWGLGPHSRIALHSNFAFDAAVEDLFPVLTAGGTLFIVPESARKDIYEMRRFLKDHLINGGSYTTRFGQLLGMDETLELDYICLGGETMTSIPRTTGHVYNAYGPTEFTVDATYYELEKGREYKTIPIGRPLYNCAAYIVDDTLSLLPPGETGELCLAGPQLALGYWKQPELTAKVFTELHLPDGEVVPVYRTGDLARWNEEGQLEFAGRIDGQVKIRGFRVELGEVESSALRFPGVRQAAAEVRDGTLCLYYTIAGDSSGFDEAALKAHMSESLADYMVPGLFLRLDTLPHTPNGKIDRKALPDPGLLLKSHKNKDRSDYTAPATEEERLAVTAMAKVLGHDTGTHDAGTGIPFSVTDDFFEFGGDSIRAIRLVGLLREQGFVTTVSDVMHCRTARKLAVSMKPADHSGAAAAVSQAPFEGVVEDTSIFLYFKDLEFPRPDYFNQSALLKWHGRASLAALQKASDAVTRQHDMLRAVIAGGHLFVRPAGTRIPVEEYTLEENSKPDADLGQALISLCEDIQSHLDPAKALIRLALIHMKLSSCVQDLFFLTAHHTIVDGVSWRIWLSDLEHAYGQALSQASRISGNADQPYDHSSVHLPAKTHTYQDYALAMKAYRSGYALSQEIPYWNKVVSRMLDLETSDAKDYSRHFGKLSVSLSAEDTDRFRRARLGALRLEVNDLLLTAVGRGWRSVFGKDALSVSLEGHGRENLGRELCLDRTIGWFTSIFPVVLEGITGDEDALHDLIQVKETLHAVPQKGIGYQILTYMDGSPEVSFLKDRAPMLLFNYLGDVSGEQSNGRFFEPDNEYGISAGLDYYAPEDCDGPDISINCLIEEGRFTLHLSYNSGRFERDKAEALANAVLKEVFFLSSFLSEGRAGFPGSDSKGSDSKSSRFPLTASDLGETSWSIEEFQRVTETFAARGETLLRIYPLTPMQEGMLLEHVNHPESLAYRLVDIYRCDKDLPEPVLRRAIDCLAAQHETLRTAIIYKGVSVFRQAVTDRKLPLTIVDISGAADPFEEAKKIRLDIMQNGYDLQDRSLTQFVYAKAEGEGGYLIFAAHHIVTDGWCFDHLVNDLDAFLREEDASQSVSGAGSACSGSGTGFRGDRSVLREISPSVQGSYEPAVPGSYERAVRELLKKDRSAAAAYFEELLRDYSNSAVIPSWGEIPEKDRSADDQLNRVIPAESAVRLAALAREAGATLADGFNLAAGMMIRTACRMDDVVFLNIVSGRDGFSLDVTDITGLFINPVPVRVRFDAESTVRDMLSRLRAEAAETKPYEFCPLSDIVRITGQENRLEGVIVSFENYGGRISSDGGERILMPALIREEHASGSIALDAKAEPDGSISVCLSFDPSLYRAEEMERLFLLLKNYIERLPDAIDKPLSQVPHLSDPDKKCMEDLSRGAPLEYDRSTTWLDLFRKQVSLTPDKIAVSDSMNASSFYTYRQLNKASDRIASYLLSRGIEKGDFVAVMIGRVKEYAAAVIGVQKTGAAFVPVDPSYPEDRIRYMLEDSAVHTVLTEDIVREALSGSDNPYLPAAGTELPAIGPELPAYMIYTSGSTGRPKGTVLSHKALRALVAWNLEMMPIHADSIHVLHPNFSFDASLRDFFPVLSAGGQVHILSEAERKNLDLLRDRIESLHATGAAMSTQLGLALINTHPDLSLRFLVMGGEKMLPAAKTSVRLFNEYGPTEFTIAATFHEVDQEKDVNIPIGRPVPNSICFVCDSYGQLIPRGMPGELCLAGPQLAEGYLKRPEITRERFIVRDGIRMYRTGDLVRWNENGELESLGRIDTQVKLRGFRIELGEIENQAIRFPGVRQAAAEVRKDRLVLYLTHEADRRPDKEALRAWLAEQLAYYMVPSVFMMLETMPLTPNGKIDRRALPDPEFYSLERPYTAPRNAEERALCDAFAKVLGLPAGSVSIYDDFLQLGGDSIKCMMAMSAAGLEGLTTVDIYKGRTAERTAALYKRRSRQEALNPGITEMEARAQVLPATAGQISMVDYQFVHIHSVMYNLPVLYRFEGLDPDRLLSAVRSAAENHPALATVLNMDPDGNVVQRYRPELLPEITLTTVADHDLAATLESLVRPFRIFRAPLFRAGLYQCGSALYLFLDMHHTISDGTSIGILLSDIVRAYNGEPLPKDRYYTFLLEDSRVRDTEEYRNAKRYFRELTEGTDWTNVPVTDFDSWEADLGEEHMCMDLTAEDLTEAEHHFGTSGNVLCITAAVLALQKYCNRSDILVKWINQNRVDPRFDHTVGKLFRELPVAVHTDRYPGIRELVSEVAKQTAEGFSNSSCDYLELTEAALQDSIEINYLPGIAKEETEDPFAALGGTPEDVSFANAATGERVGVYIDFEGQSLAVTIAYQKSAYKEGSMRRFLGMFRDYLRRIVLGL